MLPPSIPINYKDFTGTLSSGQQQPASYFVMRGKVVQGQFNLMSTGWRYYPNAKGYLEPGFEEYLKTLV